MCQCDTLEYIILGIVKINCIVVKVTTKAHHVVTWHVKIWFSSIHEKEWGISYASYFFTFSLTITIVVSFRYGLKQQNPGNKVSRKTEIVSIRVNVTLD